MRGLLSILLLLSAPLGAGAQETPGDDPALLEAGRALYDQKCAQCHGIDGDGAGVAADRLLPRPRDLTSGVFKIRTTPSGELPTDADLASIIRLGMPYTAMPAWPLLDDGEVDSLVAYIKTFAEDFAYPEMIVPPIEIPAPPPMNDESILAGQKAYELNKCFECHGQEGRGDGPSAPTLRDDWGQTIRPADLTKRWTFRGGRTRADIYRTFTTGLNGTPMPSYADSIGDEERWQLVDYVYSLSLDEPGYDTLLIARRIDGPIDPDPANPVPFETAAPAMFPLVGQVTDPGRLFSPSANGVEVRAVYNDEMIAVRMSWNDMTASREGENRPDGREPAAEGVDLCDAAAIQLPTTPVSGSRRPYFLYGDPDNPVDLWFWEAAGERIRTFEARGEASLAERPVDAGTKVSARGVYSDGRWDVVFVASRGNSDRETIPEATFLPIALSIWDGQASETGNRRAISSWVQLYLAPPDSGLPYGIGAGVALSVLLAELLVGFRVRRSHAEQSSREAHP